LPWLIEASDRLFSPAPLRPGNQCRIRNGRCSGAWMLKKTQASN
jgi:hypothetical protein